MICNLGILRTLVVACVIGVGAMVVPTPAAAMLSGVESGHELMGAATPQAARATINRLDAAGVQVIRINVSWAAVARACAGKTIHQLRTPSGGGCYSFGLIDNIVNHAGKRGIKVIVSVSRAPRWANGGNRNTMWVGSTNLQFNRLVGYYAAFVQAMATRYKAGSSIGVVAYYTIWNEPNSNTFWQPYQVATSKTRLGMAQRYAYMYAQAAKAIKQAYPRAQVAPGPTSPRGRPGHRIAPLDYLRMVQQHLPRYLGGFPRPARYYLNGWAHNPYPGSKRDPRFASMVKPNVGMGNLSDLFAGLDAIPLTRGLPVWAMEFGYESAPPENRYGVSLAQQGMWLAVCFDILWSTGRVPLATWYVFTDPTRRDDWQSGVRFSNGKNKPAYSWFLRPVSVSREGAIAPRTAIRIWGRSNVSPRTTVLLISTNGTTFVPLAGQSAVSRVGARTAVIKPASTVWVRTKDAKGMGPARKIVVR